MRRIRSRCCARAAYGETLAAALGLLPDVATSLLERALQDAVSREDYEQAARVRDALKNLKA